MSIGAYQHIIKKKEQLMDIECADGEARRIAMQDREERMRGMLMVKGGLVCMPQRRGRIVYYTNKAEPRITMQRNVAGKKRFGLQVAKARVNS